MLVELMADAGSLVGSDLFYLVRPGDPTPDRKFTGTELLAATTTAALGTLSTDASLTYSGGVLALNVAHGNIWTATQTFQPTGVAAAINATVDPPVTANYGLV